MTQEAVIRIPVTIFKLPFNYRCEIYPIGEGPTLLDCAPGEERLPGIVREFVELPIPIPTQATIWTDEQGKPIACWADGKPIRWDDLDIFVTAIEQYNRRVAESGGREPSW
jgi:hypothetical protein